MKRQGLITSIEELRNIANELEKDKEEIIKLTGQTPLNNFQINIINKTPEQNDTWEIESHQVKKDEKSSDSHLGTRNKSEEDNKLV